jgi:tRNA (cmo5U34)-methyltransferase
MTGLLAEQYTQPGSTIYDLGCSLGAATLSMRRRIPHHDCQIIAVDNSEAMVEGCRKNIAGKSKGKIKAKIKGVGLE